MPHAVDGGAATRLLRFPDIWHDRIVFTYAGDLWTVSTHGGTAVRLTSHPGMELFAKFSPDGRQLAFTGQYGGDEQVYVMPSKGGAPRQLTYYPTPGPLPDRWGYDNQVYGWTPDGKAVLFRSTRDGHSRIDCKLYTVPATGGGATALPMPLSGAGHYSPDGKRIVYSPLWRDFRSEKRYQGGWANDPIFSTSSIPRSSGSPTIRARTATRCGSVRRSTSTPTAAACSTCTATTSRRARPRR